MWHNIKIEKPVSEETVIENASELNFCGRHYLRNRSQEEVKLQTYNKIHR
jgi:hypothetical protein